MPPTDWKELILDARLLEGADLDASKLKEGRELARDELMKPE